MKSSLIQCIEKNHNIQDMGQKCHIYIFHIGTHHTKSAVFFFVQSVNVILILYNRSINNMLIKRDLCFRHIDILPVLLISPTNNYSKHSTLSLCNMM